MVNLTTVSMTGFAALRGAGAGYDWAWEIRSVNGKGLDLRLRLPDWIDGLEAGLRAAVGAAVGRGSITLSLKIERSGGSDGPRVSRAGLATALEALAAVTQGAAQSGIELTQPSAAEVLGLRGVLETGVVEEDTGPLLAALMADFPALLDDFNRMRQAEGRALGAVLVGQLDRIDILVAAISTAAEARRPLAEAALRDNLARVLAGAAEADPARVAQELALLAVKADVTEELDRLRAHVAAARDLLQEPAAVGRKFDFLIQEFMREANTVCSKSGNADLTRIGLDLKHVIDQMREQVQNVE